MLAVISLLAGSVAFAGNPEIKSSYVMPEGVKSGDYQLNTIVFRVKPEFRNQCSKENVTVPQLQKIFSTLNITHLHKIFPNHQPPATAVNEHGQKLEDLSLIYELHYRGDADLIKTINVFLHSGVVVYAEPKFIQHVCYNPNDPQTGLQYHLGLIDAYSAWNISHGDTNVVIGIIDTGTDTDHPDLAANLKHNYADPVNGVDDDNDGYVDNYSGWDLGENDNNTIVGSCGTCTHGSHVSGCAAAVTDNGAGVASPGFNCKFLPVKIADASGSLSTGYEGITYAADHGCDVINCSWGGAGGSSLGQNVINYATFNKNVLVVAAAGNNSSSSFFYPAAYDNVFCVAATNSGDIKSSFSNYGSYIDVCAPGSAIYATYFDDTYSAQSGTSMASPITAGAAALVKSAYPNLSGLQLGEQLRINADNIYSLSGNASYQGMLGSGRINLFNAVTLTGPSVRVNNIAVTDNNDNVLVVNDTMRITGDITNYLDPTVNLSVTLTTTSPYVTILDGQTTVGVLGTLATVNNSADPFTVIINSNAPQNQVITFKLLIQDGSYNSFQYFTETVNVDYINITINDVFTSNTSKGRLGYNLDGQAQGLGFDFLTNGTLMYEGGLMIGNNNNVSDVNRNNTGGVDNDFQPILSIQKNEPGIWSDFDTYGSFNDNPSTSPVGVTVQHRSMSWADAPNNRYHIFEYNIHNTSGGALSSLYAGVFADWDIQTYANNKADENTASRMGYVWCTDAGGYYAGIKVLTSGGWKHYAIDNVTGGSGGINAADGLTDGEKYQALSTNRATAGGTGTGNDVLDVVSNGPFVLNANDSVVVAFALIAGVDLNDLNESAASAQIKYDLVTAVAENPADVVAGAAYPNPATVSVQLPVYLRKAVRLTLEITDLTGRIVSGRDLGNVSAGEHSIVISLNGLAQGLYHYHLKGEGTQLTGAIQKL